MFWLTILIFPILLLTLRRLKVILKGKRILLLITALTTALIIVLLVRSLVFLLIWMIGGDNIHQ